MKKIGLAACVMFISGLCLLYQKEQVQFKDFNELRYYLHEQYDQDVDEIREAIDVLDANCYKDEQRDIYVVARNYYAAVDHDYERIVEQFDQNIAYLIERDALTELAMLYTIAAYSYFELDQYLNSFKLIKEVQPLVQHQHNKFQSDSMLKMLIFLNFLDAEIQSFLDNSIKPSMIKNQTNNILFKDVALTHDFLKIVFEYYYSKSTYQVAESYAELMLNKYGNQVTYASFITNLLRYTDTLIMFEKVEEAKALYSYTVDLVKENEDNLSRLEKIEFLRIKSKFYLAEHEYELALSGLIQAGKLAKKEKSYLIKLLIIKDLNFYYTSVGQPLIAHDFAELETKVAKEFLEQALIISSNNTQLWERLNMNDYMLALASHQSKLLKLLKWMIILSVLLVLIGSIIYWVHQLQIQQLNKQLQFLRGHLTNQLKYYKGMTQYHEKTASLALTLQQEQKNLMKLMHCKQYDRFIDRVNLLCNKSSDKKIESITRHAILDAVLQNKRVLCEVNQIKFTIIVDLLVELKMSDLDVVTITSNALDNALEACLNINDKTITKEITFLIKAQGNMILIQVRNSKEHEVQPYKGLFKTTKKDSRESHGIGLSSIERICEKYDGSLTFNITQTTFTISALLKNKQIDTLDLK